VVQIEESITQISYSSMMRPEVQQSVDATWLVPDEAIAVLVLAHGAGADHRHANMAGIAQALAVQHIATFRFNFPFMQATVEGRRRPADKPRIATHCIEQACNYVQRESALPLFLGGHSFGGRMATHAVLEYPLDCLGLVLCSFPLHTPKKPGVTRAAHLPDIGCPQLFLTGTRDDMAHANLLDGVVDKLDNAKLHYLDTANHSYAPLKRKRQHPLSVFDEMAVEIRDFVDSLT